ncbi:MAG: hypothetical protein JNJ40_07120 [Bacteroidia bacterium]|nr:hypothetical protein [Bacteroidia bacterium]
MIFKIILILHIIAGSLALLSGLFAIIFRNKIKIHKPIGKVYFWAMTIIFVSAIYMSIAHTNVFLFCVAFFTYYACLTAYRSLKLKKLHLDQKPTKFDWAIEIFFGFIHISFIAVALYFLFTGNTTLGIISLVFGILGVRGNYFTLQRFRKKLVYKNYWLLAHIGGMLGSYIGAITAFTVNNERWIQAPGIVLWLGPTVFLVPLIIYEIRKHEKKAGKFKEATT